MRRLGMFATDPGPAKEMGGRTSMGTRLAERGHHGPERWQAGANIRITVALLAILPAACTTIGPSVPVAPGAGKSTDAFAADRTACMVETDAVVQPMANWLNLVPRGPDAIAADNSTIQSAYDNNFGHCMAARGNTPSDPTITAASALAPPGVLESHPEFPDAQGPAADAFKQWFVTRPGCFDRQARVAACSVAVNLEGLKFYYGDAGHGLNGDVLVLANIQEDPTGNGDVPMVGYMRRDGAGFRFIRELPDVHAAGIAPGTVVRFTPGRISFVGLTHGQAEGRNFRGAPTPFIVPTD